MDINEEIQEYLQEIFDNGNSTGEIRICLFIIHICDFLTEKGFNDEQILSSLINFIKKRIDKDGDLALEMKKSFRFYETGNF